MSTLPPFILRRYEPTDFKAALAAIQAAEQADQLPQRTTAGNLLTRINSPAGDPRLDPADDMWVVSVRAAGVAAYADGWLVGEGAARAYRTDCFVSPDFRGRGIGRALLTRQWQRAQSIARRLSAGGAAVGVMLGARAWDRQTGAIAVLEAAGMRPARIYVEMRRDLNAPLPPTTMPAGLRLEPWLNRRADEAVWRAYDEAFADHWGYASEAFDSFMRRVSVGHIQREHAFIAWAGNEVAGASLNDMAAGGEAEPAGETATIRHLFVRRGWRGRGLGRALVATSLARAKQLGYATAALLVDRENATGAVQLYRATGFQPGAQRFMYQREFPSINIHRS